MEEIRQTAKAYFETLPEKGKKSAKKFFDAMDKDQNGKISASEFADFMKGKGYESMGDTDFFKEINGDKSGNLNFDDVKALYYIITCRRPFCGRCKKLIGGDYFTCVVCFQSDTFCLHPSCYAKGNHGHHHKEFIDNHVMLHDRRARANPRIEEVSKRPKWDEAYKTFKAALASAEVVASVCKLM